MINLLELLLKTFFNRSFWRILVLTKKHNFREFAGVFVVIKPDQGFFRIKRLNKYFLLEIPRFTWKWQIPKFTDRVFNMR